MVLQNGQLGNTYIVEKMNPDVMVQRRLQALGLTEGTRIGILNKKRNGAVIFKVRGTRLAVGKKLADSISIKEDF